MLQDVFDKEYEEQCQCEDCGETKNLQFGVCCVCGGNVIETDESE